MSTASPARFNPVQAKSPWNHGLELARASAVFLVVLAHSRDLLRPDSSWQGNQYLMILDHAIRPAWWGVLIFFSLSGFLIGRQIIQLLTDLSIRESLLFSARRLVRTIPTYWIVLIATAFGKGIPLLSPLVLMNATFLNTLNISDGVNCIVEVAWSLVIEEWSYVFLALIAIGACLVSSRLMLINPCQFLCRLAVFVAIASTCLRVLYAADPNISFSALKKGIFFQMDALAYGVIMACMHSSQPLLWNRLVKLSHVLLPVTLLSMSGIGYWLYSHFLAPNLVFQSTAEWIMLGGLVYPLSGVLCCSLCLCLWRFRWSFLPAWLVLPLRHIASISYSLYLTHIPVKHLFHSPMRGYASPLLWLSYVLLSLICGSVCWQVIEKPFVRLRRFLY